MWDFRHPDAECFTSPVSPHHQEKDEKNHQASLFSSKVKPRKTTLKDLKRIREKQAAKTNKDKSSAGTSGGEGKANSSWFIKDPCGSLATSCCCRRRCTARHVPCSGNKGKFENGEWRVYSVFVCLLFDRKRIDFWNDQVLFWFSPTKIREMEVASD